MSLGESFPEVLQAARGGAEWAWTALYRDLAPLVLGYLRSRGARQPEDLTGEVFAQVARALATFEGGESEFRSWVLVVAHHRMLDERRHLARHPEDPTDAVTLEARGALGDVEQEVMGNLATDRVRWFLSRLTEDQSEVLLLRILADRTVDEAAGILGKKPNTIKALQRRGLATLRQEILKEMSTP